MIEVAIECSQGNSIALKSDSESFGLEGLEFGRSCDSLFLPCLRKFLGAHGLSVRDVEGWTVGTGPGSFAGIRFSLALAKGICTAGGARIRGVESSFAIASASGRHGRVCVLKNARCRMLFASVYDSDADGCRQACTPAMIDPAEAWPEWADADVFLTPDPEIRQLIGSEQLKRLEDVPPADAVHLLAASTVLWPWSEDAVVEPVYVRPPA